MLTGTAPANQTFKVCKDLLAFTSFQIERAHKNQEEWVLLSPNLQQFHPHLISKRMCKLLSSKHPTPFHSDARFLSFFFSPLVCHHLLRFERFWNYFKGDSPQPKRDKAWALHKYGVYVWGGKRGRLKGGGETRWKWGGVMTGRKRMNAKKKKKEMRKVEDRCRKEKKR